MITLQINDVEVRIEPREGVFTPTPNGLFYARSIHVEPGERVLDIGTGSGILAILAAKLGGDVEASDPDPLAVEATRANAELNGVTVEARVGAFFEGAKGRYDVIVANLPNEIVAPAHLETLSPEEAATFAGGPQGNELLLALLRVARPYMHRGTRLYLPVHSLTDYHGTLDAILQGFRARFVSHAVLPAKPFVERHLDFYRALDDGGVISIFRRDGRWHTRVFVYELTLA